MNREALTADIAFALHGPGGLDRILATGAWPDLSAATVSTILGEAARFADTELLPLNAVGDRAGARLADGRITTAPGWKEAYGRWTAAGWNGLGAPADWGGQGLPILVQMAVQEIWNAANAAFATGPMLTAGAIHALAAHAGAGLKARFLPKLVSGEWMATMNLTEPQAGSDLGAIKTRAERSGAGSYRIFGQKIFITYGDHDLAGNIVHLVLARLADAPPGTAGISMFVVPKRLDDGSPNDVAAIGIERKLGLHGSPTCTMAYGERGAGASGWLVGEENRGLTCMFTMMNLARLNVGIQGVGVAAEATAKALAYARERRQGRASGAPAGALSPIVAHPDIQRELSRMTALTAASRAICYACAAALDMSAHGPADDRRQWAERASLLTPVAKAFATDAAIAVTSAGLQVHGGAGYIEETGAAQLFRDARIFAIYEGTNGIQAIDLVTRRLKLADGATVAAIISEISAVAEGVAAINRPEFGGTAERLGAAAADLAAATHFLSATLAEGRTGAALAGATPYLKLFGLALGGALLAKGALTARDGERDRATALARFNAETFVGETAALAATVTGGAGGLDQASAHLGFARVLP